MDQHCNSENQIDGRLSETFLLIYFLKHVSDSLTRIRTYSKHLDTYNHFERTVTPLCKSNTLLNHPCTATVLQRVVQRG